MSGPQTPVSLSEKPTTINDLPPELITSIYKHLDKPSSITALSSTCRKNYLIWQSNAVSISSAVIYDKISGFSKALELLYIQEKIRGVDFTTNPPPIDRLLEIQQEARDVVLRDQKGGCRGSSLSDGDHSTILARNRALISNAKKAEHVGKLHACGVNPKGIIERHRRGKWWLSYEDFVSAFYLVWIVTALGLGKAMEQRMDSIKGDDLEDMMAVVQYMIYSCPDNDKIYLGVSHRLNVSAYRRPRGIISDLCCQFDADWVKAFLKISEVFGGLPNLQVANYLRSIPWGCSGTCSMSGITEVKEEDLSLESKDGDDRKGEA